MSGSNLKIGDGSNLKLIRPLPLVQSYINGVNQDPNKLFTIATQIPNGPTEGAESEAIGLAQPRKTQKG